MASHPRPLRVSEPVLVAADDVEAVGDIVTVRLSGSAAGVMSFTAMLCGALADEPSWRQIATAFAGHHDFNRQLQFTARVDTGIGRVLA